LNRKVERLLRQSDNSLQAISTSAQQLRAICFGQDRYWRRYWTLPCAGGVFVEAMESAEPEIYCNCEENNGQVTLKEVFSEAAKQEKEVYGWMKDFVLLLVPTKLSSEAYSGLFTWG
jgi:hypothetical protein